MAIALQMIDQVLHGKTPQIRVNAAATIVMWFSAGAFITSTLGQYVIPQHTGTPADLIGGIALVTAAVFFKAP
jgi:hypothetical protein